MDRFSSDYLDDIEARLYSSVLADILDDAGYRHQVMHHDVRPLYTGAKAVGRAATMLAIEVTELPPEPYRLLMDLLDGLKAGEVVVGAVQGNPGGALWGELLSTHTRARGGRGTVLDGLSRDSWGIAIRGTIPVAGVSVADGDLVFADGDGCVVVPAAVEEDVVGRALEKVSGEDTMREILAKGASIKEVFKEYGIL